MPTIAERYADKRVLVTGGLGFIGSNLAIALVEAAAKVTIVDAMLPAYGAKLFNIEPVRERARVNISDLRDAVGLGYLVSGQDIIFNLAGQASHLSSMAAPLTDLAINCQAQLTLLESCRKLNPRARLVLASTRQVYGRPQRFPVDEEHPTVPVDINGVHKIAAESYYRLYRDVHGLPTVILRLTNTYGPRADLQSPDKGVVGVFLRQALGGETLRLFGSGGQRRDFNYVEDVVNALLYAGADDSLIGGTFNLGHRKTYSLLQLAEMLHALTGCGYEMVPFPADQLAIDIGDYYSDFSKFHAQTGWEPLVDLEEGLAATLAFARQHAEIYLAR